VQIEKNSSVIAETARITTTSVIAVLTVLEVGISQRELSNVNVWNFLPSSVNFSTLNAFKRSIVPIDFSLFLKCVME